MNAFARSTLPVLNVLGYVVLMFAATMLVPLAFALIGDDGAQRSFNIALFATAGCGLVLMLATRPYRRELQVRDGFLLVTLAWTVLPAFATLPLLLQFQNFGFTDAYFEAMSGLTPPARRVCLAESRSATVDQCVAQFAICWASWASVRGVATCLCSGGGAQAFTAEPPPLKAPTHATTPTPPALYAVYFSISIVSSFRVRFGRHELARCVHAHCSTMGLGDFSSHSPLRY